MNRFILFGLATLVSTIAGNSFAQSLPGNDIWLASIDNDQVGDPVKISTGTGYNNQPHFSDDGFIVYYSREAVVDEAASQTDVAAYDIRTSTTRMVNHTSQDEYSPTPIPGRNALSVIQVEPDQKQRLWAIDVDSGEMELLLPHVEPVGYHAWINENEVAMFILGDSFTLQTATLDSLSVNLVADNIGRSIRKHPETGEILFVDKNREPWQIAAFNPETGQLRGVMPLFPANEDFTVDAVGNYWSGNGSKLYKRTPGDSRWALMADYKMFGLNQISRLAINLNSGHIAIVSIHPIDD
jgi:hypothetical protein